MALKMIGLNLKDTTLETFEKFSMTKRKIKNLSAEIMSDQDISECTILSTCNRIEVYYISNSPNSDNFVKRKIISYSKIDLKKDNFNFKILSNYDCVRYICEVSCGVHSNLIHDMQIVSQLDDAITLARENKSSSSILNKLFQIAITCGKYSQAHFMGRFIPLSASIQACKYIENFFGEIGGLTAVIIGNGKMGISAAEYLLPKKVNVIITMRTYKHGHSVKIKGAKCVDYADRYKYIENADFLISATSSPHYTICKNDLEKLNSLPKIFADLAIPRDIEGECKNINKNIKFIDLSDLKAETNKEEIKCLKKIALIYTDKFYNWFNYSNCMQYIDKLKATINDRIKHDPSFDDSYNSIDYKKIVDLSTELILQNLKDQISPKILQSTIENIKKHTR